MDLNLIKNLNNQIEELNKKSSKAEAQREMMNKNLMQVLAKYEEKYGVSLNGSTLAEIRKNIKKEYEAIEKQVSKEASLAEKVIGCINSGDIEGAKSLLGYEEEKEEVVEVEEEVAEEVAEEEPEGTTNKESGLQGIISSFEDSDFFGEGSEGEDEEEILVKPEGGEVPGYIMDDMPVVGEKKEPVKKVNNGLSSFFGDDDEEEAIPQPLGNSKSGQEKKTTMSFFDDDDDEDGDDGTYDALGDYSDDEDDDIYGGFGSILAGTKFENKN